MGKQYDAESGECLDFRVHGIARLESNRPSGLSIYSKSGQCGHNMQGACNAPTARCCGALHATYTKSTGRKPERAALIICWSLRLVSEGPGLVEIGLGLVLFALLPVREAPGVEGEGQLRV